jgi:hypothetical protein
VLATHAVANGTSDTAKKCAKIDPNQPRCRFVGETQQVIVIYPNNGNEQVTHKIAQRSWPQRQKGYERGMLWRPQIQDHDRDDDCKHRI